MSGDTKRYKAEKLDLSGLLKKALKFSPDIIVPGEMCGKDAIIVACEPACQTVLFSLHTESAKDLNHRQRGTV